MSWSNDLVLEFLELYRREQHLWDPKHPQHKNRIENNNAWLRIQSSLSIHCSVVDLKKKKESLMTSFRMHLKRKLKSQDGYSTTWFAYPIMESFLGGKYECDNTNQLEHEFYTNDNQFNTQTLLSEASTPRTANPTDKKSNKQTVQVNNSKTKNFDNTELKYAKKQMDDAVTYLKNVAAQKRESDECELYGRLLAKKLRKLDEHQRDVAMHEIDNIMFRARMQIGGTQRSYTASTSPVPRKIKSPIFIVTQENGQQFEDENTPYQNHMQGLQQT